MKLFSRSLGFILGLLFLSATHVAAAESIDVFFSEITILENASIAVEETITYEFGTEERHGIFREIPYRFDAGLVRRETAITVEGVQRNGISEPYSVERESGFLRVKIGDAEKTISGTQAYSIRYTVQDAMNYFSDYDELYWNVTGTDWDIPIHGAQITVLLPAAVEQNALRISCYVGVTGTNTVCDTKSLVSLLQSDRERTAVTMSTQAQLYPREGMTIAIGFPKGLVQEPTTLQKRLDVFQAYWIFMLPVLAFAAMWWLWYTRGRDPKGRSTVIPEYDPPAGIRPILVGALHDGSVQASDITAGLIWLAEQGYIRINRTEEKRLFKDNVEYELTRLQSFSALPEGSEKELGEAVFAGADSVLVSSLKGNQEFAKRMKELKENVYAELARQGFYHRNPQTTRIVYIVIGVVIFFIGQFSGGLLGPGAVAAFLITALIVGVFGVFMPRKTHKGIEAQQHILGFKRYLSVAESERLKYHNAPEKKSEQFLALLPFAVALGVEKQWATQFGDMHINPPGWYNGAIGHGLLISDFGRDFSGFTKTVNSGFHAAASHSGSGGGGSVGGGFGGGGGGSW